MRKKTLAAIALSLLLTLMVGCTTGNTVQQPNDPVALRIAALRGPTGVGMVKMLEDMPSMGDLVTTEYQIVETPDIAVARLINKEVDIAALPTNLAAKLYNQGTGHQLLAINTWGNLFVVSNGIALDSWDDLRGQSINSIGIGATPDIVFRSLLKANGLDADKDLSINYSMPQVELANALVANVVQMAILPEPLVTSVLMRNSNAQVVMNLEEEWQKIYGSDLAIAQGCLVVSKEFADKHPQVVEAFLNEYQASIEWVNSTVEQAGLLIEKHGLGMTAKVAEQAIPRSNIRYADAFGAKTSVETYLQALLTLAPEAVGGKLPDAGFYYQR